MQSCKCFSQTINLITELAMVALLSSCVRIRGYINIQKHIQKSGKTIDYAKHQHSLKHT